MRLVSRTPARSSCSERDGASRHECDGVRRRAVGRAERRGSREAVQQGHAVEQQTQRERAQQEIFHRRFVRPGIRLQIPRQDVERHGHRLEPDENRHELDGRGHDHHPERRAEDEDDEEEEEDDLRDS